MKTVSQNNSDENTDSGIKSEFLTKILDNIYDGRIKEAFRCVDENIFKPQLQKKLVKFCIYNNNLSLLKYILEIKNFDYNLQYNILF